MPGTPREKPRAGGLWQCEIKLDGYWVQLHKRGDIVRMFTRSGLDWTAEFAPLCRAASKISAHNTVLDGEVIVQNPDGTIKFNAVKLAIVNAPHELRLGRRQGRALVYAGKVGTGFSARRAQSVRDRLSPLHRAMAPLDRPLNKKGTVWVEPKLSASIELTELTDDGLVRHASSRGWRDRDRHLRGVSALPPPWDG